MVTTRRRWSTASGGGNGRWRGAGRGSAGAGGELDFGGVHASLGITSWSKWTPVNTCLTCGGCTADRKLPLQGVLLRRRERLMENIKTHRYIVPFWFSSEQEPQRKMWHNEQKNAKVFTSPAGDEVFKYKIRFEFLCAKKHRLIPLAPTSPPPSAQPIFHGMSCRWCHGEQHRLHRITKSMKCF